MIVEKNQLAIYYIRSTQKLQQLPNPSLSIWQSDCAVAMQSQLSSAFHKMI